MCAAAAAQKVAPKPKKKREAKPPKTPSAKGKRGRKPEVKDKVLAEGLKILGSFKWDAFEASAVSKKGYLNTAHLKQLCIHKGLFDSSGTTPNKMQLLKPLMNPDIWNAERQAAVAGAAQDSDDTDDDDAGGVLTT